MYCVWGGLIEVPLIGNKISSLAEIIYWDFSFIVSWWGLWLVYMLTLKIVWLILIWTVLSASTDILPPEGDGGRASWDWYLLRLFEVRMIHQTLANRGIHLYQMASDLIRLKRQRERQVEISRHSNKGKIKGIRSKWIKKALKKKPRVMFEITTFPEQRHVRGTT